VKLALSDSPLIKLLALASASVLIICNKSCIFHTPPGCALVILNLTSLGSFGKFLKDEGR